MSLSLYGLELVLEVEITKNFDGNHKKFHQHLVTMYWIAIVSTSVCFANEILGDL